MNDRVLFTTAAALFTSLLVSQLVAVYIALTKDVFTGVTVGLASCGTLLVALIAIFIGEARR